MPYTKLTITVPGSVWIGEVSRAYPETGFRVLAATTCSPSGGVQLETTVPLLLMAIEGSGVPLETPFEIRNGRMELEAMLPQHRLSTLSDQFERFDIDFTVDEIRQDNETDALLTERQRWLVEEAVDQGYYDTPWAVRSPTSPSQSASRNRPVARPSTAPRSTGSERRTGAALRPSAPGRYTGFIPGWA